MKTRYKYIHFVIAGEELCKKVVQVHNNRSGGILGHIYFYQSWKRYCFVPAENTIFSADCLDDISHFLGQLK